MTTIASDSSRDQIEIAAGVDTHQDTHTVAAVDAAGRLLGHSTFPATGAGYHALLAWLHDLGVVLVVGIEGTGAYGAAMFHLFTHAFFKALLFLGAGSVIIGMHHEQDMRFYGGLRKAIPITFWGMLLGTLSALKPGGWFDHAVAVLVVAVLSGAVEVALSGVGGGSSLASPHPPIAPSPRVVPRASPAVSRRDRSDVAERSRAPQIVRAVAMARSASTPPETAEPRRAGAPLVGRGLTWTSGSGVGYGHPR